MLMTVDKDMNLLPVSVRVGQAVDVVAQVSICSIVGTVDTEHLWRYCLHGLAGYGH